jgi:uncharacterized protein (DUF362 family)
MRRRIDNMVRMPITRREFNKLSAMAGIAYLGRIQEEPESGNAPVAIVKTVDRQYGIRKAVELIGGIHLGDRDVYLKCNYNSPDPFPATTHPEALRAAVELLREKGARNITLVERSGMGFTRDVVEMLDVPKIIKDMGITFLPLEELGSGEWKKVDIPESHWKDGVEAPNFLIQGGCVVQVCNLKTHRFGGQFSASLKNSIGLIAKYSQKGSTNYMKELHASPYQCLMIAEVNQIYSPELIIMDAVQSFISGGPESGETADSGIIAASRDRVALDAAGLAILRYFGAGKHMNWMSIFEQEQIKRAVELGLGAQSSKDIRLIAGDEAGSALTAKLKDLLEEVPSSSDDE